MKERKPAVVETKRERWRSVGRWKRNGKGMEAAANVRRASAVVGEVRMERNSGRRRRTDGVCVRRVKEPKRGRRRGRK
uniref:Uncharacterized protein n=1 Tax=Cucumis melo TaxID=3656 RepID=A0A9I9E360_CUCME